MQIGESISLAVSSVKANKLRSFLTLLSVSIGVFAIIGVTTVVGSFNSVFSDQMASLGSNTFLIRKFPAFMLGPQAWRKYMKRKDITYRQAEELKRRATLAQSIGASITTAQLVKGNGAATDAPVSIAGGDENFCVNNNFTVNRGRQIVAEDALYKRNVAALGADVAQRLFDSLDPLDRTIAIGPATFTVIGVLGAKGSSLGASQDNFVLIPIATFMKYFTNEWSSSVNITVRSRSSAEMEATTDQVIGVMRTLRKVQPWEDNDFEILTNDSLTAAFEDFTKYLSYFAVGVSAISLLAAGIGIMNIMLVSVKERTREIGIRKAIGATRATILTQFIIEAVTLCQLGGFAGIILGIAGGNILAAYMKTAFVVPYMWTIVAVLLCSFIGVSFGAYPAWRASSLDPIEALRYE